MRAQNKGMSSRRQAQLALLDVASANATGPATKRGQNVRAPDVDGAARRAAARRARQRGPLSAEMTVKFCNDLLAALDRVEEARLAASRAEDARAEHLVNLFEAAVRTTDATEEPRRRRSA